MSGKRAEPMQDAMKAYLELAFGLTEASRKKAEKTVKKVTRGLLGKGSATASQLQSMTEELVATGSANRDAVARLVKVELDRALSRVGLATAEELAVLSTRVEALERQLRDAKANAGSPQAAAVMAAAPAAAEPDIPAAAPRKAPATRTAKARAKTTRTPATAREAPAKTPAKAPAKKTVAKKTVVQKAVAKKTVARKAPAKKTTPEAGA